MKKTTISIVLLVFLCGTQNYDAYTIKSLQQEVYSNRLPLTKVFDKLSKTNQIHFFYSVSDFQDVLVDDSKINYQSLKPALDYMSKNYPFEYIIQNNTVTIRKTTTKKILENKAKDSKTIASTLKKDTIISNDKVIDEVVMVGYGKQNKKDITGSISSIDEKQMKGVTSGNFGDIIAGKATGLQITQANASPGSSPTIRVRGIGTLTAGSNPLIVVDGFPLTEGTNINAIDPNSIAKMDILKDAASTTIYGSRGANGVILIQTKEGKKDKLEVTLDTYYGIQMRNDNVKFVDAYDMAIYLKEARNNNYLSKGTNRNTSDDNATRLAKGASLRELIPDYLKPYLAKQPGLTNTNWYNIIFRPAPVSNTTFSVLGGGKKSKFAFTGTYFNQQGIIIGTDYERYSSNFNLSSDLSDRLKIGVSITPTFSSGNLFNMSSLDNNPIMMANIMYPFFAARNKNGDPIISEQIIANTPTDGALGENPLALAEMTKRKYTLFKTFGNIFAELTFLKDLRYKITLGGDYSNYEYNYFDPSTVGRYREAAPDVTTASRTDFIRKNYLIENLLSFDKKIGNHSISFIAGQSYQQEDNNQLKTEATDFPDNSITNISGGTSFKITPYQYKWTLISYFGRFIYNYENKYNVMASVRRDGSSRFGINTKNGDFYAFSLGWSLSNESFFPKNNLINPVKLRYSIGSNGNNQVGNFAALSLMNPENYVFGGVLVPGYRAYTAPNPNLTWEKSTSNNFGIDLSLFHRFLNISADYYILDRDGLLLDVPVPEQSGYSKSYQNIGRVRNNGFEIQLSTKTIRIGENFEYSNNLNFSSNKNKVLALGDGQDQIIEGYSNFSVTKVGGSIGEMYGYNILGVYKSQQEIDSTPHITGTLIGDYIMEDLNKDGKIDTNDKKSFGSGIPKYILGFNNSFKYKNFELNFSLYSELGRKLYNSELVSKTEAGEGFGVSTQYYFDNRYNPETNPNGFFAMPNMNFSNNRKEARTSSIFFMNGDYVRLRSLKLAYHLPQSLISALKIKSAQIYFLGNNLFTITSYRGQNIDANSDNVLTQGYESSYYPVAKTYSFGMNFKF